MGGGRNKANSGWVRNHSSSTLLIQNRSLPERAVRTDEAARRDIGARDARPGRANSLWVVWTPGAGPWSWCGGLARSGTPGQDGETPAGPESSSQPKSPVLSHDAVATRPALAAPTAPRCVASPPLPDETLLKTWQGKSKDELIATFGPQRVKDRQRRGRPPWRGRRPNAMRPASVGWEWPSPITPCAWWNLKSIRLESWRRRLNEAVRSEHGCRILHPLSCRAHAVLDIISFAQYVEIP